MAGKDLSEKKLEDYNDVFADILNTLLFKKDLILPSLLEAGPSESVYKAVEKSLRGQYRDTFKYYKKAGIILAGFGMENETEEEGDMPIRVMGYDYSAYRAQIDKGSARYPVITIVLNFSEKEWSKPVHLKDILEIPEGMEEFVKDYEITVFNIAFLPDEIIASFKSTFKHVAHFFKNKRRLNNYQPLDEEIEHLEAFLDLLKVFTGDKRYEEIKYSLIERQRKGEVVTMCTVVEKFTNDGIKQGIKQGIEQGIRQGIEQGIEQGEKQIILNMHNRGCDAETIFNLTGISLDIVKNILENAI